MSKPRPISPGSPPVAPAACRLPLVTAYDVIDDASSNIARGHELAGERRINYSCVQFDGFRRDSVQSRHSRSHKVPECSRCIRSLDWNTGKFAQLASF